jgi:hypothetical protein
MNYRKIWERHFGPTPLDEQGRKYDIHHIDGDRSNNDISNLIALSVKDHYDVHYKQGDWNACILIRKRLDLTKEEIDDINKKLSDSRVGSKCPDYVKDKIAKTLTGRKRGSMSKEWRDKIAKSNTGRKRNNGRTGSTHSEETKRKIGEANSKALKGKKHSEERRLKAVGRVPPNKGIPPTDETKEKMSKAKKGKPWTEARRLAQQNKNK